MPGWHVCDRLTEYRDGVLTASGQDFGLSYQPSPVKPMPTPPLQVAPPAVTVVPPHYPGDSATVADLLHHADEFRVAALVLVKKGRARVPSSWAPFRLCAIHAIELYLNALLKHFGATASQIRSFKHDLAARASVAVEKGLVLRKRTAAHLASMHETREYLVTRYGPELGSQMSKQNRLSATLEQVASGVTRLCELPAAP